MKIHAKFRGRFRDLFSAEEKAVDLPEGANVKYLLNTLCDTDKRRMEVFDNEGTGLRSYVAITRNGRFIIHLDWLDTPLGQGDQVDIFTLAGGG